MVNKTLHIVKQTIKTITIKFHNRIIMPSKTTITIPPSITDKIIKYK